MKLIVMHEGKPVHISLRFFHNNIDKAYDEKGYPDEDFDWKTVWITEQFLDTFGYPSTLFNREATMQFAEGVCRSHTVCEIFADDERIAYGATICNPRDCYSKEEGRIRSLHKAVAMLGDIKHELRFHIKDILAAYHNRPRGETQNVAKPV